MKRLILLLPLLVACSRMPKPEMVEVTFSLNQQTKAFPNAIVATLPQWMDITLTNVSTTEKITATTGELVTLPVGEYAVSGHFNPTRTQGVIGTAVYLSLQPAIYIDQNVTIYSGAVSYTLDAIYRSWVLAVDGDEVSKWTMIMDYKETPVDFLLDGTTWWIFCTGEISNRFITTKVTPTDTDGHAVTTFNLATSASYAASNDGYFVEPGKWYWLHPEEATTSNSTMGLRFPDWTYGTW